MAIVNTFLNTLTFKNSPTGVMMLHAIKPTTNAESLGYGWTWWRSTGTPSVPAFPNLAENHFTYNWWNWNSVAPFIKTVRATGLCFAPSAGSPAHQYHRSPAHTTASQ